ncbi:MAG: squalene synthase HpnC [Burkholderiaceae bacterium]|nr:squalene synthase HpnC [Burkholderiaceae bacterium]
MKNAPNVRSHYENFPVASWLCPPYLRPAVAAIYWFARTADDIADEGSAGAQQRLDDLAAYRADLLATTQNHAGSGRWPQVFEPLAPVLTQFKLPTGLLTDLISAFEQDIGKTRDASSYANQSELLDYCRRSANPVGRLLLHLYGITDAASLQLSDQICTALQLINFWQDLSQDIPRGRFYLPTEDCARHGVSQDDLTTLKQTSNATNLIAYQAAIASATMLNGSPLVHCIPGRAGWELRLVVQGGLRILDKIKALDWATLQHRPKLTKWDAPIILWRALWM